MKTFVIGDVHGRRAQLNHLLEIIPRDASHDMLILLGDIIDRGDDVPGTVADVVKLKDEQPERVLCLRGNHEQMLLDFVDESATLWLHAAVGSECTFRQYTGKPLHVRSEQDFTTLRQDFTESLPPAHLDFFRTLPLFHEDDYALYVHAGLSKGQHPRDTPPQHLLWSRDSDFFRNYTGKPCVFGHTPAPLLPLRGRLGRHGIYISHSAIGIDSGYINSSPLSCLQLPDCMLYQAFADGHTATHHLTAFMPETLRALQRKVATHQPTTGV
ncbi:MAG TPA: metallophosphoesterase family protein [Pyrinomonadaceae bacterium]|jgi:serine/threonine protein phosphatase 1